MSSSQRSDISSPTTNETPGTSWEDDQSVFNSGEPRFVLTLEPFILQTCTTDGIMTTYSIGDFRIDGQPADLPASYPVRDKITDGSWSHFTNSDLKIIRLWQFYTDLREQVAFSNWDSRTRQCYADFLLEGIAPTEWTLDVRDSVKVVQDQRRGQFEGHCKVRVEPARMRYTDQIGEKRVGNPGSFRRSVSRGRESARGDASITTQGELTRLFSLSESPKNLSFGSA